MKNWIEKAIFYAIYPLGFCGAPPGNDFSAPPQARLEQVHTWLDHIQTLGANALYLGPVFESSAHGYDTADYYWVDRRLGSNETLAQLSASLHQRGMRLVLDGVFNHVGRHFWAFRDLLEHGESSPYRDWFCNLRFDRRSPYNDPFSYEGWNGHYELVKLNLGNPQVRDHLFGAVETWVCQFDIDGLRLDAADCLDLNFLKELSAFCRSLKPDFWLMGEVIHGDYRRWANPETLDSVTNYECYKGLYSSHVDRNYFEIAYALNRQSGPGGIYRDLLLYNFADNHDVDRVASSLANPAHLYTLYILLFSMPGVPSIYYGSEWGIEGKKSNGSDLPLRPWLDLDQLARQAPQP
ncbi:MAG TPA: alpha-amylase family glycosyl hydrolase, partial [Anaerolineaceae bacterium]